MATDVPPSFDKLIDEVEYIDSLLTDGPGDDSGDFLHSVQEAAEKVRDTAQALTVEHVDDEFPDDEGGDDGEEES